MPDSQDQALEARFHEAMLEVYQRAKKEVGYNATRFLEMVSTDGGLTTARRLLASATVSDGFTALWAAGRQDLTVEAVVLRPDFITLFTGDELAEAATRLGLPIPPQSAQTYATEPADTPLADGDMVPGDSAEQREAETILLGQLEHRLGVRLGPHRFGGDEGLRVEVDGFSASPAILVEIWAHIGPAKSAQKHKVLGDVLKLVWLERRFLGGSVRKIILFGDAAAARHFAGRSWMAVAVRDFGVEVLIEELPAPIRERIVAAQARQYR